MDESKRYIAFSADRRFVTLVEDLKGFVQSGLLGILVNLQEVDEYMWKYYQEAGLQVFKSKGSA